MEVLAALSERAEGDRLLVSAAYRPLGRRHPAWRQLDMNTAHLDGLDEQAAAALVTSHHPDAPVGLAAALRTHTGGSSAYMRALLREHSTAQLAVLAGRGELPAPADLAASLETRVSKLSFDAANLLHALAILGDTWSDLGTAAAVVEVKEPDLAVKLLAEENLVRLDRTSAAPRARLSHAVIQAAAYGTIPTARRRQLHGAAAARSMSTGERLRHRVLGAAGPDEGLAGDLDRHADNRHQRLLYREAARLRRMAAQVSAADPARDRRLLDADVEALLAIGTGATRTVAARATALGALPRSRSVRRMIVESGTYKSGGYSVRMPTGAP